MGGIVVKLDGVTLTEPAWLVKPWGDLVMGSAADGSGAVGGLLIDDEAGTRRIRGWQSITVDEPLCSLANNGLMDAPRVFTGYAGRRTYSRGPYKSGPGRFILVELLDSNIVLSTRLITGGDAMRPAETDTERIAWLLSSDYLSGLVQDLGLVNGTGLDYDATNTHGQYPSQVLQDLAGVYDEIFFTYWDQSAEALGLFWDFPNSAVNVSPLSISNDLADINDDDIWAPHLDGQLDADPADVWSYVRYVYSGGVVYVTRQATADEFFTDNGLDRRGTQIEFDSIGKATTATTFATRFLAATSEERLAVTCTVRLPATHVNLLDAGMLVPVKMTHLPDYGFDDFTNMRIQGREVTQVDALKRLDSDLEPLYDVKLTLALTGTAAVGHGGGGGPGGPPGPPPPQQPPPSPPPTCANPGSTITPVSVYMDPLSNSTVSGVNGFHITGSLSDLPLWPTGTSVNTGACCTSWWGGGPTFWQYTNDFGTPTSIAHWLITDTGVPDGANNNYVGSSHGGCQLLGSNDGSSWTLLVDIGDWTLHASQEYEADTPADRTWRYWGLRYWEDFPGGGGGFWQGFETNGWTITECLDPAITTEPPAPGQWSQWETVTMTVGSGISSGTTAFPYATGSLEVKVDGVPVLASHIVEDDNTTGAFHLDWEIDADETVTVRYQGI